MPQYVFAHIICDQCGEAGVEARGLVRPGKIHFPLDDVPGEWKQSRYPSRDGMDQYLCPSCEDCPRCKNVGFWLEENRVPSYSPQRYTSDDGVDFVYDDPRLYPQVHEATTKRYCSCRSGVRARTKRSDR